MILIESNTNDKLCVSEISTLLGVSPSAVSQHFRMFELAGLVTKTRQGQRMCYEAALGDPTLKSVATLMKQQNETVYA